jgi:signal peptidase I
MARKQTKKDGFWETVKTVFWALIIAMVFRSALYQPFSIPSGSMKPTLLVGDYLFVSKFAYGYSRYSLPFSPDWFDGRIWGEMPKRGDVVVFKLPGKDACTQGPVGMVVNLVRSLAGGRSRAPEDCVDYVKRVIGLPGDRIQMVGGVLHINGEALPTVRAGDFVEPKVPRGSPPRVPNCANEPVPGGGECRKEHWRETLPEGREHSVLNTHGVIGDEAGNGFPDKTAVYTVPEGHLFFMGDNRDNSVDSRYRDGNGVGFVPFENLIGRAEVVALSADGPFWQIWNWRGGRFFKSIE